MRRSRTMLLACLLAALAVARAEAILCPGNGARLTIVVNNPTTTTGQTVFLSGNGVAGQTSCVGQSDTYATTVTLAALGDNTFTIPVGGGLNTGVWVHHISIGSQFQHQRVPVLFTTTPSEYAEVRWTYHPTVLQVTTPGDPVGGFCLPSTACSLRQAITTANIISPRPVLIQMMLPPGTMTQSADLAITGSDVTIDGTDVNGTPWIVGDALAAAAGNQSTFSRAVDLADTTRFTVGGSNVRLRGMAIINTTASGIPTKTLIESTGADTRIEAVRLDGGSTATCASCPPVDTPNLVRLPSSGSVTNVEARSSRANGIFTAGGGVSDSWIHHNYRSGVAGPFASVERSTIELTGRRINNTVVNANAIGIGGASTSTHSVATEANLIRNNSSFGIETFTTTADNIFIDDAVCGNGDTGITVINGTGDALGTGMSTTYNNGHGVLFSGTSFGAVVFDHDSAFTANANCGFANGMFTGITASADNNQWRGATTSCTDSAGVDLCTGTGFGPVSCPTIQDPPNVPVVLDTHNPMAGTAPVFPMNATLQGQTLRVQGEGFNAIAGNPLPGTGPGTGECVAGSTDVSAQNCCRKKSKANVCAGGAPPTAPSDDSMCVAMIDPLLVWRPLDVTSVTPTTIITETPSPFMACIGDAGVSYLQSIRVVKRDSLGGTLGDQMDYCRNS